MKYLEVKNFERFQHYRNRTPPWIKLYNSLLDDFDFLSLPEAARAQLVLLWLVASRHENRIPADDSYLRRTIHVKGRLHIKTLLDAGFLAVVEHPASTTPATSEHRASKSGAECLSRGRGRGRGRVETEQTTTSAAAASAGNGATSWLGPVAGVWEGFCGTGSFPAIAGQAAKCLRPLVVAHGADAVGAHLTVYLAQSEPRYRAINRFAANYAAYTPLAALYEADGVTATPYLSKLLDPEPS